MLDRIEIEPHSPATTTVIWLHGLGADGHDFEPLVRQWDLADTLATRFILPHAPVQPVTLNGGMRMRAWYDLYDLSFDQAQDAEGLERARAAVEGLISEENQRGIASERIVLAGFSQGGALALHTALRREVPLAGVLVLSAYLPLHQRLPEEKKADAGRLILRMDHGERDPVVPYRAALASRDMLESEGYRVDFHSYDMEHSLCPPQMASLRDWLVLRLTGVKADRV